MGSLPRGNSSRRGSTRKSLEEQLAKFKRLAKKYPKKRSLYKMFNEIGDYNFYIELLDSYEQDNYCLKLVD
jgi:hypothetical protein